MRENLALSRNAIPPRDQNESRQRLLALRNVRVEFAVEAHGVGARIFPNFGEKQRVESGSLRAPRETPGLGQERFIVLRKRNGLEARIDVLRNPGLQPARGNQAPLPVLPGELTVDAMCEACSTPMRLALSASNHWGRLPGALFLRGRSCFGTLRTQSVCCY